jgi:hypothetical protein
MKRILTDFHSASTGRMARRTTDVPFLPVSLAAGTCIMEIEAASGEDKARTSWGFTIKER